MDSDLASILTVACLAMCSRVSAEPALQLTPRSQSPRSTGQKTQCHGSLRRTGPSARHASSRIPTEPTTARSTIYSSSPVAPTLRVAISPNRTSCPPDNHNLAKVESEHHLPHPNARLWYRTHRVDTRFGDSRQYEDGLESKKADGNFRTPECAPERQCEPQFQRRDNHSVWMEGAEQIPSHVRE